MICCSVFSARYDFILRTVDLSVIG